MVSARHAIFNGGACERCEPHCMECGFDAGCDQYSCDPRYFRYNDDDCVECGPHCGKCYNQLECIQGFCDPRYFLDGMTCEVCGPHCEECYDFNYCKQGGCQKEYFLNVDSCDRCGCNCLSCYDFDNCKEDGCAPGYQELFGVCEPCNDPNCDQCNNDGDCLFCKEGFGLDSATNKCVACPQECGLCSVVQGALICTTCAEGYTVAPPCLPCILGCAICAAPIPPCITCKEGFFPKESGTCENCIPHCRICDNNADCIDCFDGYFVNPITGQCDECGDNCVECADQNNCIICEERYFLNDDKECDCCSPGCLDCVNTQFCDTSEDGFLVKEVIVEEEINTICVFECGSGFSEVCDDYCKPCPENCAICPDGTTCTRCQSGFFLNAAGDCDPCGANCVTCTDPTHCTVCRNNFFLFTDPTTGNKNCVGECGPRYFENYQTDACDPCSEHCLQCDAGCLCEQCEYGFCFDEIQNKCVNDQPTLEIGCGDNLIISYCEDLELNALLTFPNCEICKDFDVKWKQLESPEICGPLSQFTSQSGLSFLFPAGTLIPGKTYEFGIKIKLSDNTVLSQVFTVEVKDTEFVAKSFTVKKSGGTLLYGKVFQENECKFDEFYYKWLCKMPCSDGYTDCPDEDDLFNVFRRENSIAIPDGYFGKKVKPIIKLKVIKQIGRKGVNAVFSQVKANILKDNIRK